jgi:hypothetical protein
MVINHHTFINVIKNINIIMEFEKKYIELDNWINEKTASSKSVVELGAGFFNRLSNVNNNCIVRIGIEIYKPYIDNATYHNCIKINGDALKYKELLKNTSLDTVMIIDVLEHFEKDVAYKLISNLKKDFKKIILMLPYGLFEQHEDITGFGGHEYQTHKSFWYKEDVEKLKFNENVIDETFHSYKYRVENNLDLGCYFGVWNKK